MRRGESGFALLLVFLMSATIAIMLYTQLPRAAFEAQRMKEEMLVERGEEYVRAIQLYTAKWTKYPQSIEDLEGTNGRRFLRHRYKDPMTGKDEWRLLHIDAAGVLTDSKVKKKEEKKPNQNTFISESVGIGQDSVSTGAGGTNIGLRKRDSDKVPLPMDGSLPGGPPVAPPNGPPPPPNGQGVTSAPIPGQPQLPTAQALPPSNPNSIYPNSPATAQPQTGAPQNGPTQPGNAALDMIGKILTSPNPNQNGMQVPGAPGLMIGGGIAGVASKMELDSIKIYNERKRYDEWEFVYDIKKDKRLKQQLNGMNNGVPPTGLTPQNPQNPQMPSQMPPQMPPMMPAPAKP